MLGLRLSALSNGVFRITTMDVTELVSFWAHQYEHEEMTRQETEDALMDLAYEDLMDGLDTPSGY